MKKSGKIFIFAAALFSVLAVSVFVYFRSLCSKKDKSSSAIEKRIQVPEGMTARELGKILEDEKIIKSADAFYLGARFPFFTRIFVRSENPFSLKSGVYRLSSGMSLSEIYDYLTSGKQEYIRLSFPEGLTKSKIARILENAEVCSAEDFKEAVMNPEIIKSYGISSESLEGYLFPDTYFFIPGMNAENVARTMVDNFFEKAKTIPALEGIGAEELDRTVRLASIVEREYRVDDEAPLIASVFKNRIRHGWGLYSCATIEYIITEIEGREHPDVITYADLSADSPYNTYKWAGLPPTAISNPGLVALSAAADTPKTNYFYFRLVDENEGRHVFTQDFSSHISEGYSYRTKKTER